MVVIRIIRCLCYQWIEGDRRGSGSSLSVCRSARAQGNVAVEADAVQTSGRIAIVVDRVMHGAAVIPHNHVPGVPVVPVATNAGSYWPARGVTRSSGVAVYEILDPIEPGLDRKTLMARLTGAIEPASERLLEEANAMSAQVKSSLHAPN